MTMQMREELVSTIQIGSGAYFDDAQLKVIKNTLCPGISDEELELFAHVCRQCKLDPFLKQIYAIMRKEKQKDGSYKQKMVIQASIDGLRLTADRTGKYVPGRESTFEYDNQGRLYKATSYIKKQAKDGSWHEVSSSALYNEFKPAFANNFWDKFPHIMLAKAAEAQALRKAFPAEMCGLLSEEEMHQADMKPVQDKPSRANITQEQVNELLQLEKQSAEKVVKLCKKAITDNGFSEWKDLDEPTYIKARDFFISRLPAQLEKPRSMDEVAQEEFAQEKSVFEGAE